MSQARSSTAWGASARLGQGVQQVCVCRLDAVDGGLQLRLARVPRGPLQADLHGAQVAGEVAQSVLAGVGDEARTHETPELGTNVRGRRRQSRPRGLEQMTDPSGGLQDGDHAVHDGEHSRGDVGAHGGQHRGIRLGGADLTGHVLGDDGVDGRGQAVIEEGRDAAVWAGGEDDLLRVVRRASTRFHGGDVLRMSSRRPPRRWAASAEPESARTSRATEEPSSTSAGKPWTVWPPERPPKVSGTVPMVQSTRPRFSSRSPAAAILDRTAPAERSRRVERSFPLATTRPPEPHAEGDAQMIGHRCRPTPPRRCEHRCARTRLAPTPR